MHAMDRIAQPLEGVKLLYGSLTFGLRVAVGECCRGAIHSGQASGASLAQSRLLFSFGVVAASSHDALFAWRPFQAA